MRILIGMLFFLSSNVIAQKTFNGKITYKTPMQIPYDSIVLTVDNVNGRMDYYDSGKINSYYLFPSQDSCIYMVITSAKAVYKSAPHKNIFEATSTTLFSDTIIQGYFCTPKRYTLKDPTGLSTGLNVINWETPDLFVRSSSYKNSKTLLPSSDSTISLMQKIFVGNIENPDTVITTYIATSIIKEMVTPVIFQLPAGYTVVTDATVGDLLKTETVEVTLEDVQREEVRPEPLPPPPPSKKKKRSRDRKVRQL